MPKTPTLMAIDMLRMINTGSFVVNNQNAGKAHRHVKSATKRYMRRRPNRFESQPMSGIVRTAGAAATVRPMVPTDLSTSRTFVR